MGKVKSNLFGIIGLGRFGAALAMKLAEAGREVIVVDNNECKVKELRSFTDYAYVAEELSREALEQIGIQNCDTVIVCIGEAIDTSILVTLNVVNLGVRRVIAKAISKDQGEVLHKLGAEVVYPERDMALRVAKTLISGSVRDYIALDDDVEICDIRVTKALAGKSILNANIREKFGLNIIALEHNGRTDIEFRPQDAFSMGDGIVVIGKAENVRRFEESIED